LAPLGEQAYRIAVETEALLEFFWRKYQQQLSDVHHTHNLGFDSGGWLK